VTDEGGYGRFGTLSRVELERFFYLDDEDRRLIAARRRDYNRLGFALQVVTVRQLGMFLADPLDVPPELIDYLAEQLGIEDSSCVKQYTERKKTKLEHAWEIQREYGLTPYTEVESELAAWVADQAWMTGDGPKAMFAGAVDWLRTRQVLLPGPRTLERLVTDGRQAGDQRLWGQLTGQLTAGTASALLSLLDAPDGKRRVSELERLRKGVFRPSSKGMVAALDRLADLIVLGGQALDVSMVPQRRVIGLATYGLSSKAPQLRRLEPRQYRLAVMVATVKVLSGRATDDVLELFDLLMVTDLMSKAERESRDEKLRRYPRVSRYAGKLAAAVKVLLEMTEVKPDLSLDMMWDLIENTATKSELRAAVAVIDELVPVDDAELNGQRLEELAGRLATVRVFLPLMMRTVVFGAAADGAAVLAAMKTLGELMTTKSKLSAAYLDARKIDHDLIGGGWKRLVHREGRPPETVDRAAYTLCLLASVDGIRFVVPVRTIHARPNPKYFGRKRGITWLNMLNDQSAGLAAKVLSGTPRDSLNFIDVVQLQRGGKVPDAIITDTGSYSDIVFGLIHLTGRKYRPQLANLPDQRLWRIDTNADYGPLNQAARGRIDTDKIAAHWEDMCRVAVSIHSCEVSAHDVTRMISRDGNPTQLGQAIAHYGRIFKTLHILRLADDEPYRREGKAQANLVGGRHDLARRIYHGKKGEMTRHYYEGMEDQLSALGLVLNCVVLWNTVYSNRAVEQLRAQEYPVLDTDEAKLSAFIREHIGIDGHYAFHLPDLGGNHRPLRNLDSRDDD
jgi:TnpA family transposase